MSSASSAKTDPALIVRLLGGFSTRLPSGKKLFTNSKRLRLLLAYLLLHRQAALSRDQIAFELWPDSSEAAARANLRSLFFRFRQELPNAERIFSLQNNLVAWRPDAQVKLDLEEFERAMERASTSVDLSAALDLYTGPLLPELYEEWAVAERERLHLLYQSGLRRLVDLREQGQDDAGAIQAARRLLQADPLREESYGRLMQLYARKADRSGLEQVWQECVAIMERELGLPPSPILEHEYQRLKKAAVADTPRHNLPSVLPPFVGRGEELVKLAEQLTSPDCHLLTLVGAGGIGKSRLAQQVAQSVLPNFLHGVFFVALTDIENVKLMPALIADEIGLTIRGEGSPARQILREVRDKEMLLILDNYEHLLPESQFIEQLLMQAPRVTLLITSRERLSLRREWIYTVQGLPVYAGPIPDPSTASAEQALRRMSSAVQLFVQSARRVHPSFILEQETVGQIVKICDLLEGMPLGIELAASWSRLLSCGDIFDHLQDSMDLLTTSMRDIPERHRSLRAIFDNSWGLLTETEQDVLAKLSVFRGGFTLESAIQVVGTSVPMLAAMLDKSLLRLAQDGRYDQHELLRQYTQERLAESSAMQQTVRDRHARHYAHYMLLAAQRGIGTPDFMAMIATEIDNIRQAWRLAMVRQDYAVLAQFILGLGYFYEVQGWRQEASEVFTAAYEAMRPHVYPIALSAADKVQVFATLLAWMGFFYPERDAEKSFQLQNEALTLMRPVNDGLELATALTFRARSANDLGEYELARQDLEECLAILHRINMLEGQSVPLQFLGINYRRTGRYAESIRCHREALAISQIAKIDRMNSAALADLSIMSLLSGDPQEARRLAVQALHICQQSGDVHLQGLCYTNLALAVFALGDFAEAKAALVSALEKSVYLEMNIHLAVVLAWLARTHLALDELEQAQDYLIQALRTSLLPGYRRAFGVVLNTAGILLATRGPELAHVLWRAIQQDDTLYYEDRQEATDLLAQTFSPEERAAFADEPVPNFPALIRHTLTLLG